MMHLVDGAEGIGDFRAAESALGLADDTSDTLQGRLVTAAGYAVAGMRERHDPKVLARLQAMVSRLATMSKTLSGKADSPWPRKATNAAYEAMSRDWSQLVRDTWLDKGQVPPPAGLAETLEALARAAAKGVTMLSYAVIAFVAYKLLKD